MERMTSVLLLSNARCWLLLDRSTSASPCFAMLLLIVAGVTALLLPLHYSYLLSLFHLISAATVSLTPLEPRGLVVAVL